MSTRPTITEEPVLRTRAVSISGNKVVCGDIGGPACMCQPEEHGGRGACGKKIINADDPHAPAMVREQVRAKLAEIRAGSHTVRTVH